MLLFGSGFIHEVMGQHEHSEALQRLFDEGLYWETQNSDSALSRYRSAFVLAESLEDTLGMGRAWLYQGMVWSDVLHYDSANFFYQQALPFFDAIAYKKGIASVYINSGNLSQYQGNYGKAVDDYLLGISFLEDIQDLKSLATSYGNLANIFNDIYQLDQAKFYFNKALEISKVLGDSLDMAFAFQGISSVLLRDQQLGLAEIYLDSLTELAHHLNFPFLDLQHAFAQVELALEKKEFDKASAPAKVSLQKAIELGNPYYLSAAHYFVGKVHLEEGRLDAAATQLNLAEQYARDVQAKEYLISAYKGLFELYKKKGQFAEALSYLEAYELYYDSMMNQNQRWKVNELERKFASEVKDKELLQNRVSLDQANFQLLKKKNQNQLLTFLVLGFFLTAMLLWYLLRLRQKKKNQEILNLKREHQIKTLESLIKGEEKERLRISKELHDGVNGDLSAVKFMLTGLLEKNNRILQEAVLMIDKSCEQVRALSHNLVPPSLEKFSLVEAIQDYCRKMNEVQEAEIIFQHIGACDALSKNTELNLLRIAQELVNNAIKHAQAKEITVQISCYGNQIQLTVEDDGIGFDPSIDHEGIGLQNIRSRVDYLEGTLDIHSDEKGSSFVIECQPKENEDD
ncbi:ATP-binding protein [Pararhodonellum marinum]|uniref:ATP-binding protein n=1 Tax=Pararhodonellum marinum TaxID=2755358 RepID=UPI0018900605|nr:sensor histidine kinase [Pararhodonellum marinum]